MILPVGLEASVHRFPFATLAIMVLCLVASFNAWSSSVGADPTADLVKAETFLQAHPYLRSPANLPGVLTSIGASVGVGSGLLLPEGVSPAVVAHQQAELDNLAREYARLAAQPNGQAPNGRTSQTWWTAVRAIFTQASAWALATNLLLLYLAGVRLEDLWGWPVVAGLFLAGALVGNTALEAARPGVALAGADGGVAALIGAFMLRLSGTRIRLLVLTGRRNPSFLAPAGIVIALWALNEVVALVSPGGATHLAQLSGLGVGLAGAAALKFGHLETPLLSPEEALAARPHSASLQEALSLAAEGQSARSVPLFRRYLTGSPLDRSAWEGLAKVERALGRDASTAARHAVSLALQEEDLGSAAWTAESFGLRLSLRDLLAVRAALPAALFAQRVVTAVTGDPDNPLAFKAALAAFKDQPTTEMRTLLNGLARASGDDELRKVAARALRD